VSAGTDCLGCRVVAGAHPTPGGVLMRRDGLVVHALAGDSPLPGWLVITSERHVRGLYDLAGQELAALGPLTAEVMRAQQAALGAEHVYAFAIGDLLLHFHLHLVPRFPHTPERLRGRRCFELQPGDALDEATLGSAAVRVRDRLTRGA